MCLNVVVRNHQHGNMGRKLLHLCTLFAITIAVSDVLPGARFLYLLDRKLKTHSNVESIRVWTVIVIVVYIIKYLHVAI